jgi:hypothetical protein
MGDLGAHGDVEQDGTNMDARAGAGRAVLHLFLIGSGIGDEFRQCIRRKVLAVINTRAGSNRATCSKSVAAL